MDHIWDNPQASWVESRDTARIHTWYIDQFGNSDPGFEKMLCYLVSQGDFVTKNILLQTPPLDKLFDAYLKDRTIIRTLVNELTKSYFLAVAIPEDQRIYKTQYPRK